MSKALGLKEQFRVGQISVAQALEILAERGALDSHTAKWFRRKQSAGDLQRDPATAELTRQKNLDANKQKERKRDEWS